MIDLIFATLGGVALGALGGWQFTRHLWVLKLVREEAHRALEAAVLTERIEQASRHAAEQEKLLGSAREQLTAAFSDLSLRALNSNAESFLQLAESVLGQRLEAAKGELDGKHAAFDTVGQNMKELLGRLSDKLAQTEQDRARGEGDIASFLRTLKDSAERLGNETAKLSSALRGSKVQGRWGEAQLRNTVEAAGLSPHCDFQEQVHGTDRSRPDLVISLPYGRKLVVDAKVSLTAFLDASLSSDLSGGNAKMGEHVIALKNHIKTLSERNYPATIPGAMEFTMLFLPVESLHSCALEYEPTLSSYAYERRVLLVTPVSMISFLTLVSSGWRDCTLQENAREISEIGRMLYERLVTFTEHLGKVGRSINSCVRDYNSALGSLESRVLPAARRFEQLGACSGEDILNIPETLRVGAEESRH